MFENRSTNRDWRKLLRGLEFSSVETEENEKEERVEDAADEKKKSRNMIPTPKTNIINL